MKKIMFLLALLPMFVFTACSDDDEDANPINGSTWVWENWLYGLANGGKWYQTIEFTSNNTYTHYYKSTEGVIQDKTEGCSYEYNHPNIVLYHKDGSVWNTFILKNEHQMYPETNENAVFEKQ